MMRRAAHSAGLISDVESARLVMCWEPEAVCFTALFGRSEGGVDAPVDSPLEPLDRNSRSALAAMLEKPGEKFLVLDAGGGTVDLSSYEVVSSRPFQVKQLAAPNGGPYGSTQVDMAFIRFMRELIGPECSALLDRRRDVEVSLLRQWESVKVSIEMVPGHGSGVRPVRMELSELQWEVLDSAGEQLTTLLQLYTVDHEVTPVLLDSTRLELPGELLSELFTPSIGLIRECLSVYVRDTRAKEATHLAMAGGYSNCPVLWEAVREEFGRTYSEGMFMVPGPDTAIVRGAAVYGTACTRLVSHRVAHYSYGTKLYRRYMPHTDEAHKAMKDYVISDEERVEWIPFFDVHVRAGEAVPVGFVSHRHASYPMFSHQEQSTIELLASTNASVQFPNEPGVQEAGRFSVPVNKALPFRHRKSQTEIEFGDVELKCRVYEGDTDQLKGSYFADIQVL